MPDASLQRQESIQVRAALAADAAGIAKVHFDCWRSAYVGVVPDEHLLGLRLESFEERWTKELAEAPKRADGFRMVASQAFAIVGFVTGGCTRHPEDGSLGEIYNLYVCPACWRQGIGRQLLTHALQFLQQRGRFPVSVSALQASPFRMFYHRAGAIQVGADFTVLSNVQVPTTIYHWREIPLNLGNGSSEDSISAPRTS